MHLNLKVRDPIGAAFVAFADRVDALVRDGETVDAAFARAWYDEVVPRWTAHLTSVREDSPAKGMIRQ